MEDHCYTLAVEEVAVVVAVAGMVQTGPEFADTYHNPVAVAQNNRWAL